MISAVGGVVMDYGTATTTVAVSPQNVGDVIVLLAKVAGSGTLPSGVTSISGGGVSTWNKAVSFSFSSHEEEIWYGTVTATGPSTITVNWSGSVSGVGTEYNAQEFTANLGASTVWALDDSQSGTLTNSSSTSVAFPTLTPSGSGELYFGYGQCASDCAIGSTPGFTYALTWDYNVVTYNTSVTSAVSPTAPQSPANYSWSLAALLEASIPTTVPGAPTIGTATAGNASATVTWSAPASNGGSPITGYSITPYIGATAQTAVTVGNVLTYDVTGLTNGTTYTFTVAAINAVGTGAASAASNSVTPTSNPCAAYTGNDAFLCSAYEDLLGRAPDSGGLAYWESQLSSGMSRSAVAGAFVSSTEYRDDLVNNYYETYLGRASDSGGLAYWVAQLTAGASDESVLAAILGSAEFYADSGSTADGFLAALYTMLLGRASDSGGLAYWESQLSSGMSRSAVADAFLASTEYRTALVNSYYETFLGRASDSGGLSYWLAQLAGGASNESFIAAIVGSSEFYTDATS